MGWRGIMLGSGGVWFNIFKNEDNQKFYYKIKYWKTY